MIILYVFKIYTYIISVPDTVLWQPLKRAYLGNTLAICEGK